MNPTTCRLPALFLGLLVFLIAACSSPTKESTGHLEITARTLSDEAVEGVTVTVTPGALEEVTGADGRARFENLSLGAYTVTLSHGNFEAWTETAEVTKDETTEVTASLTGLPGSLTVTALHSNAPLEGATIRILDEADLSLLDQGVTGGNGQVAFSGLPSRYVQVAGDTLANLQASSSVVYIPANGSTTRTMTFLAYANRLSGETHYPSSADRNMRIFWAADEAGNNMSFVSPLTPYRDDYDVMTTTMGYMGVALFGQQNYEEMGVMFSPIYDMRTLKSVTPPLADGRVLESSPRDDAEFTPADLPITLYCLTPATASTLTRWDIFYWYHDGQQWQYSHIASSQVAYYNPSAPTCNWGGHITISTSPFYGEPLPVSAEGEYYSWWLIQVMSNGWLNYTWDHFFVLKTEEETDELARRVPVRVDPRLREAAEASLLDRAAALRPTGLSRRP